MEFFVADWLFFIFTSRFWASQEEKHLAARSFFAHVPCPLVSPLPVLSMFICSCMPVPARLFPSTPCIQTIKAGRLLSTRLRPLDADHTRYD
jgi:hypothetical protein